MHSCRCCLQRAAVKDLTKSYTHLGATEIYSDMLNECFNLHLSLGGDGECGICEVCVGHLRDASDFKLQVQRNQMAFLARLEAELLIKEETIMEQDKEDSDETCDEPMLYEEPIKSEIDVGETSVAASHSVAVKMAARVRDWDCVITDAYVKLLQSSGVFSRAKEQLALACSVRLERLRRDETYLAISQHEPSQASCVEDMPEQEHTTPARGEEPAHACGICMKQFSDESKIVNHLKEHMIKKKCCVKNAFESSKKIPCENPLAKNLQSNINNRTYSCDMCNNIFKARSVFIKHIKLHMAQKQNKVSNKTFLTRPVLKKLEKNNSTEETSSLPTLAADLKKPEAVDTSKNLFRVGQFDTKSNSNTHIRYHTGGKRYKCEKCDLRFLYRKSLTKHTKLHIHKPYHCGQCRRFFSDEKSLLKHKKIHTLVKPHRCKICEQHFTYQSQLDKHTQLHINKPYRCGQCKQHFSDEQNLFEHEKNHTGEKRYKCEKCDLHFVYKHGLNKHLKLHIYKPYGCGQCRRFFSDEQSLFKHKEYHNVEKRYRCDKCDQRFTNQYFLDRHKQLHLNKPYGCGQCRQYFSDEQNYFEHIKYHTGEKSYK